MIRFIKGLFREPELVIKHQSVLIRNYSCGTMTARFVCPFKFRFKDVNTNPANNHYSSEMEKFANIQKDLMNYGK